MLSDLITIRQSDQRLISPAGAPWQCGAGPTLYCIGCPALSAAGIAAAASEDVIDIAGIDSVMQA
jgi:hypothetical protein